MSKNRADRLLSQPSRRGFMAAGIGVGVAAAINAQYGNQMQATAVNVQLPKQPNDRCRG